MAGYTPIQFKVPKRPTPPEPYTFPRGFTGGLNTSVSPDLIAENESPDMCNINYDDGGVPTKRLGLARATETSWGATPVRGMYEYWKIGASAPVFLVAHGGKIYSYNPATDTAASLMSNPATITDAVTGFFTMNDVCYIYNGAGLYQYIGAGTVTAVVGYAPLYITDLNPDGTGGASNEELNLLSDSWQLSYSGTSGDTEYVLNMAADSIDSIEVEGVPIAAGDYTFPSSGDYAKVTFDVPPGEGVNNVVIQAHKTGLNDATIITHCTIFQIYGGKQDTRVAAAGHPTLVNQLNRSHLTDPTYWPISKYEYVTSDAEAITGLGHIIDYQIIGKERSYHYATIATDTSGNVSFDVYPFNSEYGCLAGRTVQPAQGGLLALSCDNEGNPAGVAWVIPSMVRNQLNVNIISDKINRALLPQKGICDYTMTELRAAHAIIHDRKYYLFVADKTFVLDLEHSSLANGAACWYPYDTVFSKVGCFLSRYTGELWIGDGKMGVAYKPQTKHTATAYQDDATAYTAYWQAPLLFCGTRDWEKIFELLHLSFKGQPDGTHSLTFITDQGNEVVALTYQEEQSFDYDHVYYDDWSYGINYYPYPQTEDVGYQSIYLSWKISNNKPDQGMTVLAQSLKYSYAQEVS